MALHTLVRVNGKAIGTHHASTNHTTLEAARATGLIAQGTATRAAAAAGPITMRAGTAAVGTNHFFTAIAAPAIFRRDDRAAIVASQAVPVIHFHVRPPRGVGAEQPIDNREEIQQPSAGQRRAQRLPTIPFTQDFFTDVRMGDGWIRFGRMRIQGYDLVGLRLLKFLPIQSDLEAPRSIPSRTTGSVVTATTCSSKSHWTSVNCSSKETRSR